MNPFSGTWVANIEKSRRHANHQFQSATLSFEISGDDVSLTHSGINMSGKRESGTTLLHPDGREHPVSAQAPGVVAVTRWVGTHVLEWRQGRTAAASGKEPTKYLKTAGHSPQQWRARTRPACRSSRSSYLIAKKPHE